MKVFEPGEEQPLAWTAILEHTPIESADGQEVGTVSEVLGSETADIFHGIVVREGRPATERVIPAEEVSGITNRRVQTRLTDEAIRDLPLYAAEDSYRLGFVGLLRRRLGWVKDEEREHL